MSGVRFFREQKLISFLLMVSVVVVLIGVGLIYSNQQKAHAAKKEQAQLNAMQTIANMATQELQSTLVQSPSQPIADIKPAASVAKVTSFNGKEPEVGTDDWCEWMMVKDSSQWTPDEQTLFAKHCI